MVKHAGLTLTNKTTASAEDCKEMCRKKRNLCDGWNWNRVTRNCELFSVVTKCSDKHANYKSGLCEGLWGSLCRIYLGLSGVRVLPLGNADRVQCPLLTAYLSSDKELLWVAFVGWLVGLLVVGKKSGKMWKLTVAMCKTKTTEPELIMHHLLFLLSLPVFIFS